MDVLKFDAGIVYFWNSGVKGLRVKNFNYGRSKEIIL